MNKTNRFDRVPGRRYDHYESRMQRTRAAERDWTAHQERMGMQPRPEAVERPAHAPLLRDDDMLGHEEALVNRDALPGDVDPARDVLDPYVPMPRPRPIVEQRHAIAPDRGAVREAIPGGTLRDTEIPETSAPHEIVETRRASDETWLAPDEPLAPEPAEEFQPAPTPGGAETVTFRKDKLETVEQPQQRAPRRLSDLEPVRAEPRMADDPVAGAWVDSAEFSETPTRGGAEVVTYRKKKLETVEQPQQRAPRRLSDLEPVRAEPRMADDPAAGAWVDSAEFSETPARGGTEVVTYRKKKLETVEQPPHREPRRLQDLAMAEPHPRIIHEKIERPVHSDALAYRSDSLRPVPEHRRMPGEWGDEREQFAVDPAASAARRETVTFKKGRLEAIPEEEPKPVRRLAESRLAAPRTRPLGTQFARLTTSGVEKDEVDEDIPAAQEAVTYKSDRLETLDEDEPVRTRERSREVAPVHEHEQPILRGRGEVRTGSVHEHERPIAAREVIRPSAPEMEVREVRPARPVVHEEVRVTRAPAPRRSGPAGGYFDPKDEHRD